MMKLMFVFLFSCFNYQLDNDNIIVGTWKKVSENSNIYIVFLSNKTLQLIDKNDQISNGNLRNVFCYELIRKKEDFQLKVYLKNGKLSNDTIYGEISFFNNNHFKINPANGKNSLFNTSTEFIKE